MYWGIADYTQYKLGFNSTWTEKFQMYKLDSRKTQKPEIKLSLETWQILFYWALKSLQTETAAMKLKEAFSLEEKQWQI